MTPSWITSSKTLKAVDEASSKKKGITPILVDSAPSTIAEVTPAEGSPPGGEAAKDSTWQADFEDAPPAPKESLTPALGRKSLLAAGPDASDTEMVKVEEGAGSQPSAGTRQKEPQSLRVVRRAARGEEASYSTHPG